MIIKIYRVYKKIIFKKLFEKIYILYFIYFYFIRTCMLLLYKYVVSKFTYK